MKTIFLYTFTFIFSISLFAGDTTSVRIHDGTDMTWYGNYDEWGVLPDASKEYRKIYLHYNMGCATAGCSDWDYTTQISVRHRTGAIDSSLESSPIFTVNGNIVDSVLFSDTVFIHFWNTTTNTLDSNLSTNYQIIEFNNPNSPTVSTDTIYGFEAGFYNMVFDSLGTIIDSLYITPTNTMLINYNSWYKVFDVIEDYELARVITPYGSGLANDWQFTHVFDITDFVQILRDSVDT